MKKAIVPICVIIFLMFTGCYLIIMEYVKLQAVTNVKSETAEEEVFDINSEASDGLKGILLNINEDSQILAFQDLDEEKIYEIPYETGLKIIGKYGSSLTFSELNVGEIYELDYSLSKKKLIGLKVSDKTWTYTDVRKFSFDEKRKIMTIADESFLFTKKLRIFSEGKPAEIMDITEMDTLVVRGDRKKILSVVVDKGHGYLRILNDAYFVGGWIEIGQDIIKPVTEDMLIPVPEGKYDVKVTNKGYAGKETLKIIRDKETELDLSKIEIEEVAIGHILFSITPDYAQLFIDNEITEFTDRVPLCYGIHSVKVECSGYNTINTNIKVTSDYADVEIKLDESTSDSNSSSSSTMKSFDINTSSSQMASSSTITTTSSSSMLPSYSTSSTMNNIPTTSSSVSTSSSTISNSSTTASGSTSTSSSSSSVISSERKIFVDEPAGAEVYLDGNYIGIAPVSTTKVTGSHVITLSKEGYKTKSYTVNIENDGNDITFSFSGLIEE